MTFLNQLIAGICNSGPVMLIACSLAVVLASSRVLNVAVGASFALVGIVAVMYVARAGLAAVIAFCLVAPIVIFFIMDTLVLRVQRRRSTDPEMSSFAATLGVSLIVTGFAAIISSSATETLSPSFFDISGAWTAGRLLVSQADVIVFAVAVVVTVALYYVLYRTTIGLTFRATAADRFLARTVGVRPNAVISSSWVIAGVLVGFGTFLTLVTQRSVEFDSGNNLLLLPFAAVIAGSMGNLAGTALASLFFGVAQALSTLVTSSDGWQGTIVFGLVMAILIFRPEGFLPGARTSRAY